MSPQTMKCHFVKKKGLNCKIIITIIIIWFGSSFFPSLNDIKGLRWISAASFGGCVCVAVILTHVTDVNYAFGCEGRQSFGWYFPGNAEASTFEFSEWSFIAELLQLKLSCCSQSPPRGSCTYTWPRFYAFSCLKKYRKYKSQFSFT